MKISVLLACFAATTALARPNKHYDDEDKYNLNYNFTMKAFRIGHDSDKNDMENIGVDQVGFNAPVVMGYNMLWRLEDGVLSPAEHPDYKVDVSLLHIYPPRVALLPRSFQSLPGYKVQAKEEHGEMMISVARPVLEQLGTFTGIKLRKGESLVFLPFGETEIRIMAEKEKDNQRYHHRKVKDSDFLLQCNRP